jgi:hypothetical protein
MNNKIKYRFKTQEELFKEFGPYWRYKLNNITFSSGMDYLLGKILDNYEYILYFDRRNTFDCDGWIIGKSILIEYKPTCEPTYEPKTLSFD